MLAEMMTRQVLKGINTAYNPLQESRNDSEYTRRLSTLNLHAEKILHELIVATYNRDRPLRRAAINAIESDSVTRESVVDLFNKLIAPVIAGGYGEREQVLEGILRRLKTRCKKTIAGIEVIGKRYHNSHWTLESEAQKVYTLKQHEAYKRIFDKYLNPTHQS